MRRHMHARFAIVTSLAAACSARVVTSCAESAPSSSSLMDAAPAPTQEMDAIVPSQAGCEAGAWCRVDLPMTTPVAFNGIWGSGPDDVWIVGSPNYTLHWNGTRLSMATVETRQALFGVWGSGKDDIWTFTTTKSVWHTRGFDGDDAGWTRATETTDLYGLAYPPVIAAMWGASAADVWAVGPSMLSEDYINPLPSVFHSDGWHEGVVNWQAVVTSYGDAGTIEPISFNAICGGSRTGVWIVGDGGKTRYTSATSGAESAWTPVNSQTSRSLYTAWCSLDGVVWAGGAIGAIRRFMRDATGEYGSEIVDSPTNVSLRAMWGTAADDIWAVGDAGTILHWDGTAWTLGSDPANRPTADLFAIWGTSENDIWIAGRGVLLHKGDVLLPGSTR